MTNAIGSTPPPLPAHVLKLTAKHSNAATAVGYSPPKKAVYSPANNKVVTAPVVNLDTAAADGKRIVPELLEPAIQVKYNCTVCCKLKLAAKFHIRLEMHRVFDP